MSNQIIVRTVSSKTLSKADYEALAAFRYSLRKFLHFSEQVASKEGLTTQQHQTLLAIKGYPKREKVTIGELAERLQIKHHSVVGLANRLVSEGYIARIPSPQDQRQVFLQLTRRGQNILTRLSMVHKEELKNLTPKLLSLLKHLQIKKNIS
jgi:DNA-binding MarR family transcriptional regulator